jgi:hypothetical protein
VTKSRDLANLGSDTSLLATDVEVADALLPKADKAPEQKPITSTAYTAVLLDVGKTVTRSNAAASTHTIPAQASVSWADNTQLNFLNLGAGTVTVVAAAGVTINGTPLTLATSKGGSLVRTASNTWTFTPTGGGGKVLQVVRATDSTSRSTTSASFVDVTGMTVTITPTRSNSNVIIVAAFACSHGNNIYFFQITDSSNVAVSGFQGPELGTVGVTIREYINGWAYASPGTTSAVTFKLRFRTSSGAVNVRNDLATGQMYAIEVEA